jgi:hypothetical protein
MALIKTNSEAALMIQTKLIADTPDIPSPPSLGPVDVLYGDRDSLAHLPAITIEMVDKKSNVTPFLVDKASYAAYIMVYYGRRGDPEASRLAADQFAEEVVKILNEDPQWPDGVGAQRLIKGWVTRLEPGYARRGGDNIYAARITWEALSQAPLGG